MTVTSALDITVVILSYNEEIHIARCLERISPYVRRIVVIDSFSTDATVAIARGLGAEVFQHRFENHAAQLNWALSTIPIDTAWTLRLDCDEYLDEQALGWMLSTLHTLKTGVTAVEFRLKMIFKDKPIMHGGYSSTDVVRLWRTDDSVLEQRWMDERIVTLGDTVRADGYFIDENLNTIGWWTAKHNDYATRHMVDMLMLEYSPGHRERSSGRHLSRHARIKRFLRNSIYMRVPLFIRPILYWIYRYFFQQGFLDGRQGLVWHFLHALWYYMLIDIKLYEARRYIARFGIEAYEKHLHDVYRISVSLRDGPPRELA